MEEKDKRIFLTSVMNASKRLEHYGEAKLSGIYLLKLIYKYACYSTSYNQLQRLNSMVSTLQTTDPLICMEKNSFKSFALLQDPIGIVEVGVDINQAPVITDISVIVEESDLFFTFNYETLFPNYSDDSGGTTSLFIIHSIADYGVLIYNDVEVNEGDVFTDPSLLQWKRSNADEAGETLFTFSAYDDDDQLPLESNIATCTITVEEYLIPNEVPVIGDRAQYAGNRVVTVFNLEDFTTQTVLPYFDPENNPLDSIRIDEISDANTGVYSFYGNPVVVGQVITASELSLGAFYHTAPDSNAISTDSFNASVRDTGSMVWVQ
jgi:hypothetical protein